MGKDPRDWTLGLQIIHHSNRYPDSCCIMLQSGLLQRHLGHKLEQCNHSIIYAPDLRGHIPGDSLIFVCPLGSWLSPNFQTRPSSLQGPNLAHLPFHEDIKHFGSCRWLPQSWGFLGFKGFRIWAWRFSSGAAGGSVSRLPGLSGFAYDAWAF